MASVTYNLRIDEDLKNESFAVIKSMGLTPAAAIKLFLKQTAETKTLPVRFDNFDNSVPAHPELSARTDKIDPSSMTDAQKKQRLHELLDELVESNPYSDIKGLVAWQREIRKDR